MSTKQATVDLQFHEATVWSDPDEVTVEVTDNEGRPQDILSLDPAQALRLGDALIKAAQEAVKEARI